MKKLLCLLALLLAAGGFVLPSRATPPPLPDAFRGNWVDTTTNLWALGLWDGFAVVDASFWEYGKWSNTDKSATAVLSRNDGIERKIRLELLNDSTLVLREGKARCILLREPSEISETFEPLFTAPPDTTGFCAKPWVNDSIRVEGFIVGYKPGDAVYHYWSPALFSFDFPNTPMVTDSLGRFRVSIPSTHGHIHVVGTDIAAAPGDRIFISYSATGRNLFRGTNARVNQELDGYRLSPVVRQFLPSIDFGPRIGSPMSWRYARISARDIALTAVGDYCRKHNLSRKTEQSYQAAIKCNTINTILALPDRQPNVGYPFAYFMPGEGVDYSDPGLFFGQGTSTLINAVGTLWRMYEPVYVAEKTGFRDRDLDTYWNWPRIRLTNPERFNDFMARNQPVLDSISRSITSEIRLRWAIPVVDSLIPKKGLNHDFVFAQGFAFLWSLTEKPVSGETLALIDSMLSAAPFLQDTLHGLNDRYRMLDEQNAGLNIPMGTVDSTLTNPDSILQTLIRPHAGKVVCLIFMEPGVPKNDKELECLPAVLDSLVNKDVEFVFVAVDINPQKWRNTIAQHDFTGPNTIHYRLPLWQVNLLVRGYLSGCKEPGSFLLFNRSGQTTIGTPVPKPSEGEAYIHKINELLEQ